MRFWTLLFLFFAVTGLALAQNSHVEGHVPEPAVFDQHLKRDLKAYLKTPGVHYELLRQGPTQSGVAYPKFYLWVQALDAKGKPTMTGAARVAAMDKSHFEVTHFIAAESIRIEPSQLDSIFPKALVPAILKRARAE